MSATEYFRAPCILQYCDRGIAARQSLVRLCSRQTLTIGCRAAALPPQMGRFRTTFPLSEQVIGRPSLEIVPNPYMATTSHAWQAYPTSLPYYDPLAIDEAKVNDQLADADDILFSESNHVRVRITDISPSVLKCASSTRYPW